MSDDTWHADPLVWGHGPRRFEVFLEPTCPFSARAFAKLGDLRTRVGDDRITMRIVLHSQPWHMASGIVVRAIVAASTLPGGRETARAVMAAVFDHRGEFEFDRHCCGPNLDVTPRELLRRVEARAAIELREAFFQDGLEREIKLHTRYARQNGIHVSPSFMIDGLVEPALGSGDTIDAWADRLAAT